MVGAEEGLAQIEKESNEKQTSKKSVRMKGETQDGEGETRERKLARL